MAYRDDDDDEAFDYGSLSIEHQQEFVYELIGFKDRELDSDARAMFWDVMYNDELSLGGRLEAYEDLTEYLWEEYGIEFSEIWDWEDFRAWYEGG